MGSAIEKEPPPPVCNSMPQSNGKLLHCQETKESISDQLHVLLQDLVGRIDEQATVLTNNSVILDSMSKALREPYTRSSAAQLASRRSGQVVAERVPQTQEGCCGLSSESHLRRHRLQSQHGATPKIPELTAPG